MKLKNHPDDLKYTIKKFICSDSKLGQYVSSDF